MVHGAEVARQRHHLRLVAPAPRESLVQLEREEFHHRLGVAVAGVVCESSLGIEVIPLHGGELRDGRDVEHSDVKAGGGGDGCRRGGEEESVRGRGREDVDLKGGFEAVGVTTRFGMKTPALLSRRWSLGCASRISWSQSANVVQGGEVTNVGARDASAGGGDGFDAFVHGGDARGSRPWTMTPWPAAARRHAVCRPMPSVLPVTRATRRSSSGRVPLEARGARVDARVGDARRAGVPVRGARARRATAEDAERIGIGARGEVMCWSLRLPRDEPTVTTSGGNSRALPPPRRTPFRARPTVFDLDRRDERPRRRRPRRGGEG